MWGKTLREALMIMVLALSLAGAGYALRPGIMQPETDENGAAGDSAVKVISLEDARTHFQNNDALFADARPSDAFSNGHIKGAMNLDPSEFDTWSGDFFAEISPDQMIITYCEGAQCRLSIELAEKLTWMGYENVYYLKNGWGLWKENQLPSE